MEKHEIFALIALALSAFSAIFCGFGMSFVIHHMDYLSEMFTEARRMFGGGHKK